MSPVSRSRLVDGLIAVALFALAVFVRRGVLTVAQVTPDCIGPYLGAWEMLTTGDFVGPSHFPESGPGLYWMYIPFLLGADGVEAALWRRFLLQALWAPALYLGLRSAFGAIARPGEPGAGDGRGDAAGDASDPSGAAGPRLGPLVAVSALLFSDGPLSSLLSGAETFVAPDLGLLMTLSASMVLLAGRPRWLLLGWAALPIAMMVHGMSAAYGPVLLWLAWRTWRQGRRGLAAGAVLLGAVGFLPRAWQLLARIREDGFASASELGTYNSEGDAFVAVLLQRTADHLFGRDLPWGPLLAFSPLVLALAILLLPRWRPLPAEVLRRAWWMLLWLLGSIAGILAVATAIEYMQGYHWRVVFPAAATCLGLAAHLAALAAPQGARRALPALGALVVLGSVGLARGRWPARDWADSDVRITARFAELSATATPRWHERGGLGWDPWGYAPALYLQERLAGAPEADYALDGSLVLLFSADADIAEQIEASTGWSGRPAPITAGAVTLLARATPTGGPRVYLLRFATRGASVAWHERHALPHRSEDQPVRMKAESGEYLPALPTPFDYAGADAWFPPGLER